MRTFFLCGLLVGLASLTNATDNFTVDGRKLEASHSLAVLTDEFFNGRTLALKICYSPKEIVERPNQGPTNDAERAYLVLFIDKANQIWQVNLTVVFNGMTYGNTVASESADLKKYFDDYSFDGKQLRLRSNGTFRTEVDGKAQVMSWTVDTDVPVQRRLKETAKN
jgi:hypothetical protein